jgi:hypothetical protein
VQSLTTKLSQVELRARLAALPAALAGRDPSAQQLAALLAKALGIEALAVIKESYIEKSRGGTDAAGIKWDELSPSTIAYGRRHKGLNAKRTRAAKAGRSSRPLLTAKQDKLWKAVYASSLSRGADPGTAASRAWGVVKAAGGKTIIGQFGTASVEIGRDTGRLLASLSPSSPDAILDAQPGSVRVGTKVEYAGHFAKRRPIWPAGEWPAAWQKRLADIVAIALPQFLKAMGAA